MNLKESVCHRLKAAQIPKKANTAFERRGLQHGRFTCVKGSKVPFEKTECGWNRGVLFNFAPSLLTEGRSFIFLEV